MGCLGLKSTVAELGEGVLKRKILMVGLDGAGKTTILYQMKLGEYKQTQTTIGLNVETIKHKNLELLVFDVGGQARSLWSYYFDDLDALIWVIDCADKERMSIVKEEIKRVTDALQKQDYILMFYLNKQDLKTKLDTPEVIEQTGLSEVDVKDVIVQKCSATKGEGLLEGLEKLVDYFNVKEKMLKSLAATKK